MSLDVEKVKARIIETSGATPYLAEIVAPNLMSCLPSQLMPLLERWVEGEYLDFEFQGLTLKHLVIHERLVYYDALIRMAVYMEHPEDIPALLKYYRRYREE